MLRVELVQRLLALVFVFANSTFAQHARFDEFPLPGTSSDDPERITAGPDGALWFTEDSGNTIGRITISGAVMKYPIPTSQSAVMGIAAGSDGALWFAELFGDKIGRITTAGIITEFSLATGAGPLGIAAGPDGALWFTESSSKIGRITTAGIITEFSLATGAGPQGIAAGPDDALWFTESSSNKIGRITTAGTVTQYDVPTPASGLSEITTSNNALWFIETGASKIAEITMDGHISEYLTVTPSSFPEGIAASPDGSVWFTETAANKIGRITPAGVIADYPTPTIVSAPIGIAPGPDGGMWFAEAQVNQIARVELQLAVTTGALTSGTAGLGYEATLTVQGGVPPYTWSVASGLLLTGLVLDPSAGTFGGAPTIAGSFPITVSVRDGSSPAQIIQHDFVLSINPPQAMLTAVKPVSLSQLITLGLDLKQSPTAPITGVLTLTFSPNAKGVPAGYITPDLMFKSPPTTGPLTYNFSVPAFAPTMIVVPAIQQGTVAGQITITATLAGLPAASTTVTVDPSPPVIYPGKVQIANITANSFDVEINEANSTPRDLETATFTFNPAAGAKIDGTATFTLDVSSEIAAWYASPASQTDGSRFSLTIPFTFSGSSKAIESVTVTLENSLGTSTSATGTR